MPTEEVIAEVIENAEDVVEVPVAKILGIGAVVAIAGFALVKGVKLIKSRLDSKNEEKTTEPEPEKAVETKAEETKEEDNN